MTTIGPTFSSEVIAAGLEGLHFAWSEDGIMFGADLSPSDRTRIEVAIEAHDPTKVAPKLLPDISDRQFAQVLALDGVITKAEAKAWAARGDLPDRLEEVLLEIPEEGDQRFSAEMLLSSATNYDRGHPLVPALGALLGYDAAALDDLWTRGAAL